MNTAERTATTYPFFTARFNPLGLQQHAPLTYLLDQVINEGLFQVGHSPHVTLPSTHPGGKSQGLGGTSYRGPTSLGIVWGKRPEDGLSRTPGYIHDLSGHLKDSHLIGMPDTYDGLATCIIHVSTAARLVPMATCEWRRDNVPPGRLKS